MEAASAWLLGGRKGTVDLEGLLVVVPTREAGRKLREEMARACRRGGGGLLAASFVTPPELLAPGKPPPELAGPAAVKTVWTELLATVELEEYPTLFPHPVDDRDRRAWAFRTGESLEKLRGRLLEGGASIDQVCRTAGGEFAETTRWEELRRLEGTYLRELHERGLQDRVSFTRRFAADPETPRGVVRIVVAGCPDPQPVALRALEALSRRLPVEILVHAPEEYLDRFDCWGRPLPGRWGADEEIVPDGRTAIHVAEDAEDQAGIVIRTMAGDDVKLQGRPPACGTADDGLVPFIQREFRKAGIASFDPAGRPMDQHPLYSLLEAFRNYAVEGSYRSLAVFLRQSFVTAHLERSGTADPARALAEMDRLQNMALPDKARDMREASRRARRAGLGKMEDGMAALRMAEELKADFRRRPFVDGIRGLLMTICRGLAVVSRRKEGRDMLQAARLVDESLGEMERARASGTAPSGAEQFDILLRILATGKLDAERPPGSVAIEGWLEMPWIAAPCLVVAGCNEGRVPESLPVDPYLTDSLRSVVGLRNDAARAARDAYLTRSLIESRPAGGRVILVLGRQSVEGDPLLPSRLFFAGRPSRVAARARRLFAATAEKPGVPAPGDQAVLDPWKLEQKRLARLRTSDFRLYMACPFRFYLKRILEMERADDLQEELDALDYGTAIHYALQGLGDGPWRGEIDRTKIAAMLVRRCDRWLAERFGDRMPPAVIIQSRSIKRRLAGAAAEQARIAAEGWEVAEAEIDVEMGLDGSLVGGRIDRIDRHRDSGLYRIIDYKTTDWRGNPEETHTAPARGDGRYGAPDRRGRGRSWKDLQLPLYRGMAVAEGVVPPAAELGIFYLPAGEKETGLVTWSGYGEEHHRSALACAADVIERIRRRTFWPPAEDMKWDEFGMLLGGLSRIVRPPREGAGPGHRG